MTKKKIKPMTGEELYAVDKLPYRIYLEAALEACSTKVIDPMQALKEFREMCRERALKELGYGKR